MFKLRYCDDFLKIKYTPFVKIDIKIKISAYFFYIFIVLFVLKDELMEKITDSLNTLANRLLDMIHLFYLCQIGTSTLKSYLNFDFNVKNILQRGKGIFSEIVGKHIIQNNLPPILLTTIDQEDERQMSVFKDNQVFKEFFGNLKNFQLECFSSLSLL